jgi:hypothetical protein
MRTAWFAAPLVLLAACDTTDTLVSGPGAVAPPSALFYTVEPHGAGVDPSGLLLTWPDDGDPDLAVWHVYSRGATSEAFALRGSTTSSTFHDNGIPHLQYYVTAEDIMGYESAPSPTVTVDERLTLPFPTSLLSVTLDGAIALAWSDNPHDANPARFAAYRIYSASYDLDNNLCGEDWFLEGTTVAPEFVAGAMANGLSRCFAVSAVSVEGWESLWSPIRADTPRPDARNVVVYARQANASLSGFRFWKDLNLDGVSQSGELGLIGSGNDTDIDFSVERDPGGFLFLAPVRAGTGVEAYGAGPVDDLTDIDYAPDQVYSPAPIEALVGWGYVFEMDGGDGFARYGGVRITHVGQDFLILDWSFQTDHGNPELLVGGGSRAAGAGGITLKL